MLCVCACTKLLQVLVVLNVTLFWYVQEDRQRHMSLEFRLMLDLAITIIYIDGNYNSGCEENALAFRKD